MGGYPELRPALPRDYVHPSKTTRLLTPWVVSVSVGLLAATSIVGIGIAGSIFSSNGVHQAGVSATQAFLLLACLLSVLYTVLHLLAALENHSVGHIRPPANRIHALCFIAARLAIIFWSVVMIASCVVVSKSSLCMRGTRECNMEIVVVVASSFAFLLMGILLTALESCQYPFETPEALHIPIMITCRVSSFGDDMLDRSVSQISFYPDENIYATDGPRLLAQENPKRKPVPQARTMPGDFPPERPITPLLPMAQRSRSRGWGEEWTHLVQDTSPKRGIRPTVSPISISDVSSGYARSSSGYASTSDRSSVSQISVSKRTSRPRTVTPSSSISNLSRRSPLATMRSADFPEVAINPQLRFLPPMIPAPHEWRQSRTASLSQLLPVADVYGLQRRVSSSSSPLNIQRPSKDLPPIPHSPVKSSGIGIHSPIIRRKTRDIRIPGAYIDRFSFEAERRLEEHMRMIEVGAVARRKSQHTKGPKPPSGLLADANQKHHAPKAIDSRSRYKDQRPLQRSSTTAEMRNSRPDSTVVLEATKVEYAKGRPLRRLSLGDISGDLGKMW